jgi:hypothetical protein
MAPRVVSLMLSAWILVSAFALPRPPMQLWVSATTGLSCIVAGLLAFFFDSARLPNIFNAALLMGVAILAPAGNLLTVQNDIIIPGLLLVLSTVPTRIAERAC